MSTLRRSSSSYGAFADGVIIRGVPLLTLYPGNVYWVDSNGGGGSKGTFAHPVATLSEAHDLVTTDNGDIIAIKPGHAETYTATVDFSKSGFAIVGLGFGDNRPTFTNGVLAAGDDMFDFAGDDIVIYNIKWAEAAPAGSAAVIFNISGSNVHIENCYFELGAKTTGLLTHDTTAQKHLRFVNNTIYGTAAGPDFGLKIETSHLGAYIAGNTWLFESSAGLDTGCVIFVSGAAAGTAGQHLIENEVVLGFSANNNVITNNVYLVQTDVQGQSLARNINIVSAGHATSLGGTPAAGFAFFWDWTLAEGKGLPAAIDLQGVRPINTTPSA